MDVNGEETMTTGELEKGGCVVAYVVRDPCTGLTEAVEACSEEAARAAAWSRWFDAEPSSAEARRGCATLEVRPAAAHEVTGSVMRVMLEDDDGEGSAHAMRLEGGPEWRLYVWKTVSGVVMGTPAGVVRGRHAARRALDDVRDALPLPAARAAGWIVGRGGEHWCYADGNTGRWYAAHPAGPQRLGGLAGYATRSDAALACLGWDALRRRIGWRPEFSDEPVGAYPVG